MRGKENRAELAELRHVKIKTTKICEESLESTRRMVLLCEDSKEAAIRTLVALDDQGEQLDRAEEGMDTINTDMREAEKNLTGMKKCCGIIPIPCGRSATNEFRDDSNTWNKNHEDGTVVSSQPHKISDRDAIIPQQGYVARIQNDAREDEMDENMVAVTQMVGNLRNMAIDMGSEISSQNKQLDRINMKAESNEVRIGVANRVAVEILKDPHPINKII